MEVRGAPGGGGLDPVLAGPPGLWAWVVGKAVEKDRWLGPATLMLTSGMDEPKATVAWWEG